MFLTLMGHPGARCYLLFYLYYGKDIQLVIESIEGKINKKKFCTTIDYLTLKPNYKDAFVTG